MLLSFNASRSGAFPMEGVSLQWYGKLFANDSILEAFQTSIILAVGCSLLATVLGVMAAIALVRYQFKGKNAVSTLISMPLLIPEVVLGVALLMFLKLIGRLSQLRHAAARPHRAGAAVRRAGGAGAAGGPAAEFRGGGARASAPTGCRPSAR